MKLNQNQKAWVSQLVYENVKYNETYHEVLDHVISSLEEEMDTEITFHEKLNQIWEEDFGGYENIPYLEKEREKEVNKQISKRHLEIFKSYFKFPMVLGTIISGIAFFIIANNFLSKNALLLIIIFSALIPSIISAVMYWRLKKYNLIRPSIRDRKISNSRDLAYRIFYFTVFTPILFAHIFYDYTLNIDQVYSPIFVIVVMIFTIHTLSYFRLYKEAFKMELNS